MLLPISISILSDETIGDTFATTFTDTFVVVICADIFISWPFLETKTIFSDECDTQQRNLKYAKFVTNFKQRKFHVTTLHCSD